MNDSKIPIYYIHFPFRFMLQLELSKGVLKSSYPKNSTELPEMDSVLRNVEKKLCC